MYECILGNEVYGALVVVVLVLVVLVVCRVFVPFIACLGFGLGLAPFSMQLQGFVPLSSIKMTLVMKIVLR